MDLGLNLHLPEVVLVYILTIALLLLLLTWIYELCLWIHNSYLRILPRNREIEIYYDPELDAVDIHQIFLRLWEDLGLWARMPEPQMLRRQRQEAIERLIPPPEKYDIDGYNYREMSSTSGCAICLEEFVSGDLFRVLPFCKHMYHSGCIGRWLLHELRCPICRSAIN